MKATGERGITDRLRAMSVLPAGSRVVLGIGDDCAIYRPRGSAEDLLFTVDFFVEGTHFRRATHSAAEVGRNSVVRSLSDIAAMGGRPRFCLLSLCVAEWTDKRWMDRFFHAAVEELKTAGAVLIGGDLSHGAALACDVTICGDVPRGKALRRDGALAGDEIYVSGSLGGSALGLATGKGPAWKRHLNPVPRLSMGTWIREKLGATSAIDLSDGLSLDLQRVCLASGVAAEIGDPPRFAGASIDQALHGGEEYELLFTVRRGTRVPAVFQALPLTRIGTIVEGRAGEVRYHGKRLRALGYDHFRNQ